MLIVNFKAYEQGSGAVALKLARSAECVAQETGIEVAVAVQAADVHRISTVVGIPVFAQHVDGVGFGAHTGSVLPETVKENGAAGTLLNHAERSIGMNDIRNAVDACKRTGLRTVVCTASVEEASQIAAFRPDSIAFEDPELIGSGMSISQAHPGRVKAFSGVVGGAAALCGAGISTGEDARKALELGMSGVLLASAVVTAKEPEHILREIARGFL